MIALNGQIAASPVEWQRSVRQRCNVANIGIIGLGFMGRMHYDTYAKLPEARVVAVCDADPRRAAGDLSGGWSNIGSGGTQSLPMDRIKGTTDPRELINNADVDIVDICLPTPAHVDLVPQALAAGKHVLCEKPMARTIDQARTIAAAAASATGFFMPAMCMRFWPEWEWLKDAVVDERYGRVRSATFRRLSTLPQGWFRNGELSGGALLDLHVHDTDFVYHVFGKPRAVFSRGYRKATSEIDHISTQYLYGDDRVIAAEGSWVMADGFGFSMRYTVNFERATADFDIGRKPALSLFAEGKQQSVDVSTDDGYVGEMRYFIDCVTRGVKPTRVTAEDAVAGLEIIEAEKRSVDSGQVAHL